MNGRHVIITDEPLSLGGTDTGPAPHELLPAALASCISTMIVLYAKRKAWDLDDVRVDVGYDYRPSRGGSTSPCTSPPGSPTIRSRA